MIVRVEKANYLGEFSLEVTFNEAMVRLVDLSNELEGEIFEPLKNQDYFQNFHINTNTLEWDNGADFAPEYLFLISKPKESSKPLSAKEQACYAYVKKLYEVAS
ncbi:MULTISPECIES: DUF2442 domain-containing protein [unclassified Sulfurospirillum]|uniref:DUF2442 domain-containing protein n=1 Tax=unclassified Sulfurospirillum TaxID=2618290 RepID=UPI00068D6E3D|nr:MULTISPECIES: DUF2442 domain-containing protein [unclassified Sulfurospirillum]